MKTHLSPCLLITALLALSGAACSLFGSGGQVKPTPDERQMRATLAGMQATLDSTQRNARATAEAWMTEAAPAAAEAGGQTMPTLIPSGTIRGKLSYPGESIPPLRVAAFNIDTGEYYTVDVKDRGDYALSQVPVGQYHVVAYPLEGTENRAGGYTAAVECGLSEDCTDHSLVVVEVEAGQITSEVDPADWYAPAGAFPPRP